MEPRDPTMFMRLGERDGSLRVEAHIYGIDVRIAPDDADYGLTVEQATVLRDRLTECINELESRDSMTGEKRTPQDGKAQQTEKKKEYRGIHA